MGLETGTYISDLVATNPTSSDPKSQGDDHLRLIKSTVKTTFPNVTGAVTPTHTELNYVDGVTSAIQTQIDLKAPLASPALTGTPTAPTAAAGTNTTQIASTAFVVATSLNANLPGQTGNAGKLITTDGSSASWTAVIDNAVVTPSTGTAFATTTGTQTLTNKTIQTPIWQDSGDTTKKANLVLSGITAGQNRNITVADRNITLDTPGWAPLSTVTASASATVDLETTIDSTYNTYAVVISGLLPVTDNVTLWVRLKSSGSYQSGATNYYWTRLIILTTTSVSNDTSGDAQIEIASNIDNDSDKPMSGIFFIDSPSSASLKKNCRWDVASLVSASSNQSITIGSGLYNANNNAITGIRFMYSSGNIASGTFTLFGIRNL